MVMSFARAVLVSLCVRGATSVVVSTPKCSAPVTGYYSGSTAMGVFEVHVESPTTMTVALFLVTPKNPQGTVQKRTVFKTCSVAYSFDPKTCLFSFGGSQISGKHGSIAKMMEFGSGAPPKEFASISAMYSYIKGLFPPMALAGLPSDLTGFVTHDGSIKIMSSKPLTKSKSPMDFVGHLKRAAASDKWTITPVESDFLAIHFGGDSSSATGTSTWLLIVVLAISVVAM